jgi:hypothetical protein
MEPQVANYPRLYGNPTPNSGPALSKLRSSVLLHTLGERIENSESNHDEEKNSSC